MKPLIAVFVCALLMRILLILAWYEWGRGNQVSWERGGYYELAQNLSTGKGFQWAGVPTARRPPLYPAFMAFLLPWTPFPLGVYAAQAVVGALSCAALFGLGQILFDRRAGLIASALMAVDYISLRQTVSIMTEALFVFFLILSFYCLFRSQKEGKAGWLIAGGLLSGLSLLTRDVLIFYYPCMVLWFFFGKEPWRSRLYRVGVFTIPLLLVIGPWMVRNSLLLHRPALLTIGAASTFYLANNPSTTGGTTGGEWELGRDTLPPEDVRWLALDRAPGEWERYIVKEAFDFIRDHPWRFVELTGRKIVNMWRPYQTDSPLLARWATALTYLPVITFGVIGMLWKLKDWRKLFPIFLLILYTFLLHTVLIAQMRYRYPVTPFFMIFAAWTLVSLWQKVGPRLSRKSASRA